MMARDDFGKAEINFYDAFDGDPDTAADNSSTVRFADDRVE